MVRFDLNNVNTDKNIPAIIISGGHGVNGVETERSAELYLPSSNTSCMLPALPDARYYHSQDGTLLCGGDQEASCLTFNLTTGGWTRTPHNLTQERHGHVTWPVEDGAILIGGEGSDAENTSEIVRHDGTNEPTFNLHYSTVYVANAL